MIQIKARGASGGQSGRILTAEVSMSHTPHELAEEFPDQSARIHELRSANAHFARLCDEYHQVNRAVHRAETRVDVLSAEHEAELRRTRMHLKDEIATLLRAG
jgi:uncharacterized protein